MNWEPKHIDKTDKITTGSPKHCRNRSALDTLNVDLANSFRTLPRNGLFSMTSFESESLV